MTNRGQSGIALLETCVALGILAVAVVALLTGVATAQSATVMAEERHTAESLAQSQMEQVKRHVYVYGANNYPGGPIPSGQDYTGYAANIVVQPLNNPDDGVQKITVNVTRNGVPVASMDGYKVDR